jgi:hypothetical protein
MAFDFSYTPDEPVGYVFTRDTPAYSPPVQYAQSSGSGFMDFLNSAVNALPSIANSISNTARSVGNAVGTVQASGDVYQQARDDAMREAARTAPKPTFEWTPVNIAIAAGVAFLLVKALK